MKTIQPTVSVKENFELLVSLSIDLERMEPTDKYYQEREDFRRQLRQFLKLDFSTLNGKQVLKLSSLVSTYRPVEPFSFLITCSNLIK